MKLQKWLSFHKRHWIHVAVWLSAVSVIVHLFNERTQEFEILGMASNPRRSIASMASARIKCVQVELLQGVEQGDILVILDDRKLLASLAVLQAEIQKLGAQLKLEDNRFEIQSQQLQDEKIAAARKLSVDWEQARLRVIEFKSILEPLKLEKLEQELELKSMEALAKKGLAALIDLEAKRLKNQKVNQTITEQETLVLQAEQDAREAKQRLDVFTRDHDESTKFTALESQRSVIEKALEVEEKKLEELALLREDLVLKAPFEGTVLEILAGDGDVVLKGKEIITMCESHPGNVIAFAPIESMGALKPGDEVSMVRYQACTQIMKGKITQIAGSVTELFPRLRKHPDIVEWGIPFVVEIPSGAALVPGELVGVYRSFY